MFTSNTHYTPQRVVFITRLLLWTASWRVLVAFIAQVSLITLTMAPVSRTHGWQKYTQRIHKEWIAPATSTMICAELAHVVCPVLAPYPQKNLLNYMPVQTRPQSLTAECNLPSFCVKFSKRIFFPSVSVWSLYLRTQTGSLWKLQRAQNVAQCHFVCCSQVAVCCSWMQQH